MWNTRGLRGSTFEELLNLTNERYRAKGLALIQKIPTPIVPVKFEDKRIKDGYFEQQSTVDYIGLAQGYALAFDAKETASKSLPLSNIHKHQIAFMGEFVGHKGIAFLLVYFKIFDEYYFLPFEDLKVFWEQQERKSIPYEAFDKEYLVKNKHGFFVHYLEAVNRYLEKKEEQKNP